MFRPMDGAPNLHIALRSSPTLVLLVLAIHALCLVSLLYLPLPGPVLALATVLLVSHGGLVLGRDYLASSGERVLGLEMGGRVWLVTSAGSRLAVDLQVITLWRWLVIIRLRELASGRVRSVLVARDGCADGQWRQLCVALRHSLQWQSP